MKINTIYSSLILISTIIGLGVFVLPYALFKSALFFYLWLFIIPILIFFLHLIYSEIIFQVEEKHNLPSLVAKIINEKFKLPVWILDFIGLMMVFISYLIAIDQVLKKVFFIDLNFKLIIALLIFFVIFFRNNIFSKIESFLSILLIIFFLVATFYILPNFEIENFHLQKNDYWSSYGIILFSFTGYHSLQIIYDLLGKNRQLFIKVNLISLFIIFLIYLFYATIILGVIGENIKPLSIISLIDYFNNSYFSYFAIILFLLSIITTFISLAFYLKRGLISDFKIKDTISWLIVSLSIVFLSFYDFNNLVKLISLIGSLFVGINLILILFCYLKLNKIEYFKFPKIFIYFLIVFFIIGWLIGLLID